MLLNKLTDDTYSASKLHSDIDKADKNGNTSHYLDKCT